CPASPPQPGAGWHPRHSALPPTEQQPRSGPDPGTPGMLEHGSALCLAFPRSPANSPFTCHLPFQNNFLCSLGCHKSSSASQERGLDLRPRSLAH
uniref:Uncharacterized protein n=1 Tax=Colobus angolensis palliatus TaxID=336983 RepID=A0A2K5IRZ7_COLAP